MAEPTLEERIYVMPASLRISLAKKSIAELSLSLLQPGLSTEELNNYSDLISAKLANREASRIFLYNKFQANVLRVTKKDFKTHILQTEHDLFEKSLSKTAIPDYMFPELRLKGESPSVKTNNLYLVKELASVREHFAPFSRTNNPLISKLSRVPFNGAIDFYGGKRTAKVAQFSFYRGKTEESAGEKVAYSIVKFLSTKPKLLASLKTEDQLYEYIDSVRETLLKDIFVEDWQGFTFVFPTAVDPDAPSYKKHPINTLKHFVAKSTEAELAYLSERDNHYRSDKRKMMGVQAYISPSVEAVDYGFVSLPYRDALNLDSTMDLIVDESKKENPHKTGVISDLAVSMHLQGIRGFVDAKIGHSAHIRYKAQEQRDRNDLINSLPQVVQLFYYKAAKVLADAYVF